MWTANHQTVRASASGIPPFDPAACTPDPVYMLRVLDEIDYGLLVVNAHGHILHHNHLARHELATGRILVARGQVLFGATVEQTEQLEVSISHACRGQRRLVFFRRAEHELTVSFIPLSHPLEPDAPQVLVMLSRQSVCDNLAVRMFSRAQGLSATEELVLIGLCRGLSVPEIARENGVAESTVRSQVKSLREKTCVSSIRQLLVRINGLPPVVPALRIVTTLPHNASECPLP